MSLKSPKAVLTLLGVGVGTIFAVQYALMPSPQVLDAGDRVMLVRSQGWEGPFEVVKRAEDQVTVDVSGRTVTVDLPQAIPVEEYKRLRNAR
jgi:hypothetical protein